MQLKFEDCLFSILNKILALEQERPELQIKYLSGFLFRVMGTFFGEEKRLLFRLVGRVLRGVEGLRLNYVKNPRAFRVLLAFCFSKVQKVGCLEFDRQGRAPDSGTRESREKRGTRFAERRLSKVDFLDCSAEFVDLLAACLKKNNICKNFFADLVLSFLSDALFPTQMRVLLDLFCQFFPRNFHFPGDSARFFATCLGFLEKNLLLTVDSLEAFAREAQGRGADVRSSERKVHPRGEGAGEGAGAGAGLLAKSTLFLSPREKRKNPHEASARYILGKVTSVVRELLAEPAKEAVEDVLEFDFEPDSNPKLALEFDCAQGGLGRAKSKPYSFSFFCHFDYFVRKKRGPH